MAYIVVFDCQKSDLSRVRGLNRTNRIRWRVWRLFLGEARSFFGGNEQMCYQ